MLHHSCSTGFWICLCKLHSTSFNIRSYTIMTSTKMTNFLTNCPANPIRIKQQKICFLKILESVNMWQFQRPPRTVHVHVINVWSPIGTNLKKKKVSGEMGTSNVKSFISICNTFFGFVWQTKIFMIRIKK